MSKKMGRRPKYEEWLTEDGLTLIEGWARDGLTEEQIADNMGISRSTLSDWKNKHPDIMNALKSGKEVVDRHVENALLKRALGYEYTERKYEPAKMSDEEYHLKKKITANKYRLENPEATEEEIKLVELSVPRYKMVVVEEKVKEVAPDTTAQIFWLKNRRPDQWRDRHVIDANLSAGDMTPEQADALIRGYTNGQDA